MLTNTCMLHIHTIILYNDHEQLPRPFYIYFSISNVIVFLALEHPTAWFVCNGLSCYRKHCIIIE